MTKKREKEKQCVLYVLFQINQRLLLAYSSNAERLTGKSGHQHIMIRNRRSIDLADITRDGPVVGEVRKIGLLRVLVPF